MLKRLSKSANITIRNGYGVVMLSTSSKVTSFFILSFQLIRSAQTK